MHAAGKNSPFMWLAPLLIVLVYFADTGYSIVCYKCNSHYDPQCGEDFVPFNIGKVNCSLQPPLEHVTQKEATICRKIQQKIYGKTRIIRGCGYVTHEKYDNKCVRRTGTHDVIVHFCSCTGDLCNTATRHHTSNIVTMFIPFVLAALVRL